MSRTLLKRCFGNRTMTSHCDVTNSAQQIQMTTLCHWKKLPHENFLRTPLCMMHRQASRWQRWNSKTLPQLHESASQFCTPVQICGSIARGGREAVRIWQCTHTKLTIFASNFWARKMCRPNRLLQTPRAGKHGFLKSFYFNSKQNHI